MAAKKKATKAKNPHHKAIAGAAGDYFGTLSYIHRALEAVSKGKKAAAKRKVDFTSIMTNLPQWLAMIQMIQQLIASMRPAPKPPVVVTPVVTPPVVPQPPLVPPVVTPPSTTRRVASLTSHYLGAEGWSPTRDHFPVSWRAGVDIAGAGYRLHGDSTPKDQNGEPFYNEDIGRYPDLFAKDPTRVHRDATGKWTCGEGNNRTYFRVRWDGKVYGPQGDMVEGTAFDSQPMALTSETDDGSYTPVWVVPTDLDLRGAHTFAWQQVYVGPDGKEVEGDWSKETVVHAWGF